MRKSHATQLLGPAVHVRSTRRPRRPAPPAPPLAESSARSSAGGIATMSSSGTLTLPSGVRPCGSSRRGAHRSVFPFGGNGLARSIWCEPCVEIELYLDSSGKDFVVGTLLRSSHIDEQNFVVFVGGGTLRACEKIIFVPGKEICSLQRGEKLLAHFLDRFLRSRLHLFGSRCKFFFTHAHPQLISRCESG